MRTCRTLLPAIAVASLVAATPASAGITIVEGSNTLTDSGAQGVAEAECPGGSELTGGGVFTTGGALDTAISTSYPATDTRWREYTDVFSGPHSHHAYAICDTGQVSRKSETKSIPAGKTRTVKVNCPNGKNVYGGGFYTSGQYADADAFVTKPSGDGWQAKIHNFRVSDPVAGSAYVLCGSKNSKIVSNTKPLKSGDQKGVTAECSGNDRVTGGGGSISSKTASTWISTVYPEDEHSYRAYGENGTGTDYKLTSYAICR